MVERGSPVIDFSQAAPLPMTHYYDVFRGQLAIKYPVYGHALWESNPSRLCGPVEVGDIGLIRGGRFRRLFNGPLSAGTIHLTSPAYQNAMKH